MNVVFQYLKPGSSAPDSLAFPDTGFGFENKPIPNVGDHIVLPYKNQNGEDDFILKKVIFRRFWINMDGSIQDDITLVVTDADEGPETIEVD